MLGIGQPYIHSQAQPVAWIKLTSVCLVLSIKRHSAHQEKGGEREREGMWWEGFSESYSSVREQGIEICCVHSSSLKKRVVHFCLAVCFNIVYSVRRKGGAGGAERSLVKTLQ